MMPPPPIEGVVGSTESGERLRVREVWQENLESEMDLIESIVDDFPFIAMDTEFPGVVIKPLGDFKTSADYQYTTIRDNVEMLKLIQLGLTFCDERGDLPTAGGELCVWQFNFREFDQEEDLYAPDSLALLLQSGIDFRANRERGVDRARFAELLLTSGVVLNPNVSWITFHAGYDFGYLLKLVTGDALPGRAAEFSRRLALYFPRIWDMKHIMAQKGIHGGLNKVAAQLGVRRIGPQHQAGSDSLLTSSTFMKLLRTKVDGMTEACTYLGTLHQLGDEVAARPER